VNTVIGYRKVPIPETYHAFDFAKQDSPSGF
jgi:hypothetical protein